MTDDINKVLKRQIITSFIDTLYNLKDRKQFDKFLHEFLSENELLLQSKRFAILYWLKKKRTSENIKNNLKVTVSDISYAKSISKGSGIVNAIKELEAEEWASVWENKIKNFVNKRKT